MKLTRQRINELKKIFKQVDQDDTELLDKPGLDSALTLLGYEHADLDDALRLVGRQDEGCIIFEDLKEIVSDLDSKRELNAELLESEDSMVHAFQLLADPNLGGITLARLEQLVKAQGHEWSRKDLTDMMEVDDSGHDGLISQDGFARIWKRTGL
ncbi:hypothetical protein BCR42DRAFT_407821 [Absidia repens]|uniref:EF-hand domain-containing protein n=1 Tax=Absidia repens TaxID=90262 RepID=A0A1X2ISR6_9FUNG|nr:hypothetical protein BCR42DRAFT_407821 [Absidia repens]